MKPFRPPLDARLLAALQADLPCEPGPFARLGKEEGLSEETILEGLRTALASGVIRRYGARVRHQSIGYRANVMVVWRVRRERVEAAGSALAAHPAVSHCYERPPFEGFPYNLYTMIHGKSRAECERAIAELKSATGISDFAALWSRREFKKAAPRYV
jgi:DNA-binding Lrp family transcriptional regulator